MKQVMIGALFLVVLLGAMFFVLVNIASSTPGDQTSTSIVGVPNSDGTLVTWTITTTGVSDNSALYIVLLYPSHPIGSTTTLDPPGGGGKELVINGNGSASFTQSSAPGKTFCGEIDVSVDALQASDRFIPNPLSGGYPFYDLAGSVNVDCVTPTTTTTTTTQPTTTTTQPTTTTNGSVTTTTVPPTTPSTVPVPKSSSTTPTTLVNPENELKQLQIAPGVTAGKE